MPNGSQHFVGEAENLESARARVGNLAGFWPGEYIIQNEDTGERVVITSRQPNEELNGASKPD
jgi:hypothetical protein